MPHFRVDDPQYLSVGTGCQMVCVRQRCDESDRSAQEVLLRAADRARIDQ